MEAAASGLTYDVERVYTSELPSSGLHSLNASEEAGSQDLKKQDLRILKKMLIRHATLS